MTRSAPAFWWQPRPSPAALALRPAAALYGAVAGRRMGRDGVDPGVPVLCVGNLVVGGAGKTPTAIEMARHLVSVGHEPAFVSRGYGRARADAEPIRVDPARHRAGEVGDEPLLLAKVAPCFVADDRVAAARAAVAEGATAIVMDDGLQSRSLLKTATIAVVDGGVGIGNGLCLPAGPLRAPLGRQWRWIDLVLVIGRGDPGGRILDMARARGLTVASAEFEASDRVVDALRGRRICAFSGIGRPRKFFETLEGAGLDVAERLAFPDHHAFTAEDRTRLLAAAARGAVLVTTEKDRVRLPAEFPATALPVRLRFADPGPLEEVLGRLGDGRR